MCMLHLKINVIMNASKPCYNTGLGAATLYYIGRKYRTEDIKTKIPLYDVTNFALD